MIDTILVQYPLGNNTHTVEPFGNGLINNTWKISAGEHAFILQKINHHIFKHPEHIDANINRIGDFLHAHYPNYLFVRPVQSIHSKTLLQDEDGNFFRMLPFIQNSVTYNVVLNEVLAFEAAQQFGKFTKLLADFSFNQLHETLPDFHNLNLRFHQFNHAIQYGNQQRAAETKEYIHELLQQQHIVQTFTSIQTNPHFKKRITHHDTKISNVLFNKEGKGLCVIDLDTVMPGYFISDVGDMMRTYLCPASEEETDFSKIIIREEYFEAIVKGYLSQMQQELSATELQHFVYAGKYMVYMQAMRFLTDYLHNDVYYGCKYEKHNLMRAINQIVLLQKILQQEKVFNNIVKNYIGDLQKEVNRLH